MLFCRLVLVVMLNFLVPIMVSAESVEKEATKLSVELNAMQNVGGACRLSFLAENFTGMGVEKIVFETVIFDKSGGVISLSLFDFQNLPADRPRVRQFDLSEIPCDSVGKVLINGANTCVVSGVNSNICDDALSLGSRTLVELLG